MHLKITCLFHKILCHQHCNVNNRKSAVVAAMGSIIENQHFIKSLQLSEKHQAEQIAGLKCFLTEDRILVCYWKTMTSDSGDTLPWRDRPHTAHMTAKINKVKDSVLILESVINLSRLHPLSGNILSNHKLTNYGDVKSKDCKDTTQKDKRRELHWIKIAMYNRSCQSSFEQTKLCSAVQLLQPFNKIFIFSCKSYCFNSTLTDNNNNTTTYKAP